MAVSGNGSASSAAKEGSLRSPVAAALNKPHTSGPFDCSAVAMHASSNSSAFVATDSGLCHDNVSAPGTFRNSATTVHAPGLFFESNSAVAAAVLGPFNNSAVAAAAAVDSNGNNELLLQPPPRGMLEQGSGRLYSNILQCLANSMHTNWALDDGVLEALLDEVLCKCNGC